MGLGAPKRRNKLSHDPNNTAWSRSTSTFGHKILSQQGWQPGQYLGAENADHSEHYTAANASHIRIVLREDQLGLGAKIGGNKADTFGLSLFSGVLGRLNGKSDDQVQKQQNALRDAELRQYQAGKHGLMNFVSGGLLVGDKIEVLRKDASKQATRATDGKQSLEPEKKGKKRKADDELADEGDATETEKERKVRKIRDGATPSRKSRTSSKDAESSQRKAGRVISDEASQTRLARKKSKKCKNESYGNVSPAVKASGDDKARLKQEKRARKEDRRRRKEERRLRREAKASNKSKPAPKLEQEATPASRSVNGGRHAVRHRYIQQKRMAGMDAQAMKEIFMIKAAG